MNVKVEFPEKLEFLFTPKRYKVTYGGRGASKSWGYARALLLIGKQPSLLWPGREEPVRVLCFRETMNSIKESVHQLLSDQIKLLQLDDFYEIQREGIFGKNGTKFTFIGVRQESVINMKSFEGYDIAWGAEAQAISKGSWEVIVPTIRKDGSEIWVDFNPELDSDDTYRRFVVSPPEDARVVQLNWRDNPWFPEVLRKEMEALRKRDAAACDHVYEGVCKSAVEGAIFRNELTLAEREARLTRVPYDAAYPVRTFWDIGWDDSTAIWFEQSIGYEFRFIDYLEGSLLSLQHYVKALRERGYIYEAHYLPHDAKAHELGSGRSIEEQLRLAGVGAVRIVQKLDVEDRIAAARLIFNRCLFDREKCAEGLQSLRHYQFEKDERLSKVSPEERPVFKRAPLHNWASHGADAFTHAGVAVKEQKREQKQERSVGAVSEWS